MIKPLPFYLLPELSTVGVLPIPDGMIGTYDPALLLTCIEEAAANSDYVIVYVHWGVEETIIRKIIRRSLPNNISMLVQMLLSEAIPCHARHRKLGDKPIAYSLGNFWFNSSRESGLLKLYLNPDGTITTQLIPVMNDNTYTI